MPHSLRSKIKGLRYKGIITDKDCDRLCKSLDNEGVLDKIKAEIEEYKSRTVFGIGIKDLETGKQVALDNVLAIINKYRNEVSE